MWLSIDLPSVALMWHILHEDRTNFQLYESHRYEATQLCKSRAFRHQSRDAILSSLSFITVGYSGVVTRKIRQLTWMVYLQTPRVFHSLMVLSLDPDTICLLSAEKATLSTSLECPVNWRVVCPLQQYQQNIIICRQDELIQETDFFEQSFRFASHR